MRNTTPKASSLSRHRLVELGLTAKKQMIRIIVLLIALLVSSAAQSNFATYQSWLALPFVERVTYIAGAFDTMTTFWPGDDAQETRAQYYDHCIAAAHMTGGQLATNVLNFASDKPNFKPARCRVH